MATSGSLTLESYPGQSCTTVFSWTQTGSNIANNTRTVSVSCKITVSPAGSGTSGTITFSLGSGSNVTFTPASASVSVVSNSTKTYSTTAVITCSNVTGSAAGFSRTFTLVFNGKVNGKTVTQKISSALTVNPDGITRRSAPTVPSSITLGTNFTVTTNRPSSAFTHTIQLKIGSGSFANLATGVGASISTCNASIATWAPLITTATSASGTIRTITYENGSQVGYVDNTVSVSVPASCVPTISTPTISDTNGYLSEFGYLLSGASKLHLSWGETISYGSAINSRAVKIFGVGVAISNASATGCDATITNIGTNQGVATVTITDARGRTASASTASFKICSYNKPVVGNSVVYRSDANGDKSPSGDHIAIRVPWSKSVLYDENDNEINFITLQVKVDDTLVTTYGSSSADAPNNQILVIPGTYSDAVNYAIELTVVDTVGQSSKYSTTIASVSRPMSVRAFMDSQTGTKKWGMAIGKVSEIPEVLEVDVPQYLYKNLTIKRPTNSYTMYQSTSIKASLGTSVPSELQILGGEHVYDADGRNCFYSEVCKNSSDAIYKSYVVRRYSNDGNTQYYNGFYLTIGSDGKPIVTFTNNTARDAWLSALGLENTAVGSSIITPGSGISILTATGVVNKCMISMRVSCKKTNDTVFSGRTNPLFTIASGYRPRYSFTTTAVTNSTVNGNMTGYSDVYITTAGAVILDVVTANQKEIDVHFCYLL